MPQTALEQAMQAAIGHHRSGRLGQAEAIYRQVLARQPRHPEALHLLGMIAGQIGRYDAAIDLIRQAIAAAPDNPDYHCNLGVFLQNQGQLDQAIASYQRALALRPDYCVAYNNLGNIWKGKGQLDQAAACYQQALGLQPQSPEINSNLGNVWKDMGQLDEAITCYRKALELNPRFAYAHDNILVTLHYHPDCDAPSLFAECRKWNQQHAEPLRQFIQPHPNDRDPERRLRIGYVSTDFFQHASALFLLPLFRHHDREQFEVTCYAEGDGSDSTTQQLQDRVQRWRKTMALSDGQVAAMIRQDQIDILVDLKLHTSYNRLLIFAYKPAPVQVTWLGYPGTTGLKTMDYRLTDPYLDPPGLDDAFYSEQSIRLPETFWCYDPLSTEPAVNALPANANGYVTFGCLNTFCKVNDAVLSLWAKVLQANVESRLLLLVPEGSARQQVLDRLGIAPQRVQFVAWQPRSSYLRTYHRTDIGLDTWPCNGHTTSLDSFWMGVPVITMVGRTAMGRAGASQLSNLGLAELIAHTPEEYVRLAAELCGDLPRLTQLRSTLRQRMQISPLMDGPRFARGVENAYRAMWRKWCRT